MYNLAGSIAGLFSSTAIRYSLAEKRPVTRWTLMLPGAGCEYWKNTSGGCTMCGFNASTTKFSRGRLQPAAFFSALYWIAAKAVAESKPAELTVFNGGSFWNDREIPVAFQNRLMECVSQHRSLSQVMIETRCEYITEDKIETAVKMLRGKTLKIAIGLESADDHVRNNLIRKGLTKRIFEDTVRLANSAGAKIQAYVFLKPLGLNESEALIDALNTIRYALSVGVSEVEISCAFIQPGTVMAEAYRRGEFEPPRLWTILEIIREAIANHWPVSIGGFKDHPPPIAIPANCPICSSHIYEAIERYRWHRKLDEIPDCSCKANWKDLF